MKKDVDVPQLTVITYVRLLRIKNLSTSFVFIVLAVSSHGKNEGRQVELDTWYKSALLKISHQSRSGC